MISCNGSKFLKRKHEISHLCSWSFGDLTIHVVVEITNEVLGLLLVVEKVGEKSEFNITSENESLELFRSDVHHGFDIFHS